MVKDKSLLLATILCLVLLALMVMPRSEQNRRQFANAYAEYRQAQEVSLWSH